MQRLQLSLALVAAVLLLAAPLFGFAHTVVPHTHAPGTHLHTDLYGSLASVLHRDAVVPAPALAFLIAFLAIFALVGSGSSLARNYALANALKEGRLAYRRFG